MLTVGTPKCRSQICLWSGSMRNVPLHRDCFNEPCDQQIYPSLIRLLLSYLTGLRSYETIIRQTRFSNLQPCCHLLLSLFSSIVMLKSETGHRSLGRHITPFFMVLTDNQLIFKQIFLQQPELQCSIQVWWGDLSSVILLFLDLMASTYLKGKID